jgi:hypothetical protein
LEKIDTKKNHVAQCGLFNPRVLVSFAFCSVGAFLALLSFAANPPSGLTGSAAKSAGDLLSIDKHAARLSGNANPAKSAPLAVAAAGSWSIVASPSASDAQFNFLNSVTCSSLSDCWAVGYYRVDESPGSHFRTLVEHWDGTSWSIVSSPNTGALESNSLQAVTCASASDCWAVGEYVVGLFDTRTLVERWDGTSWAIVSSPNASTAQYNYLYGVTCASASECWAVGNTVSGPTSPIYQNLIERWDGTSWTVVTSGNIVPTQYNILQAVTCVSTSDCWAVGNFSNGLASQSLIEHWDGISWTPAISPNTSPLQVNVLQAVACTSTADCLAVGYFVGNVDQTLIEHWDGSSWAMVSAPNTNSAQNNLLYGVTCVSASNCWTLGYWFAGSNAPQTLIAGWDGTSWAIANSPDTSSTQANFLSGVSCASAYDCWAVGYYSYSDGTVTQTLIEHYSVPPVPLVSVVSEFNHGSAGSFDVTLPLTGTPGVECRSSASLGAGNYTLVFSFASPLTSVESVSASATGPIQPGSSTGSIDSNDPHNYIVNLAGLPNAQYITTTLTNVTDSLGEFSSAVSATMGVLLGDVNGDGQVDSSDLIKVKQQTLQPVNDNPGTSNFRADVNTDGNINSSDLIITKRQTLTGLPALP